MSSTSSATGRLSIFALILVEACAGCSSSAMKDPAPSPPASQAGTFNPPNRGAQELQHGIRSYDNGEYRIAAKRFQSALALGLAAGDRASAHKYLAFIACARGREKSCREEFRHSFEADPRFELSGVETGHPVWGPVFRSVKDEVAGRAAQ